jgi:hypothetical protein
MNIAALTAKATGHLPDFFRSLGYEVDWDFSKRTGKKWYEILDGDRMVFQIDEWATVEEFLRDLPAFAAGERDPEKIGPEFDVTYEVRCPNIEDMRECLRRVMERK